MTVQEQSLDAFARAAAVLAPGLGWLLGAGASAAAGVPTAQQIVDDCKASVYCARMGLERGALDLADPLVADDVRLYFDGGQGLPPVGDPGEYAAALELAYPAPEVRRAYFDWLVRHARPSFGHRALAALLAAGHARLVVTTNFDELVERAAEDAPDPEESPRARLVVAALGDPQRAAECLARDDWPLLMKLHGDFREVALRNVPAELREQDETMRRVVLDAARRFGLAVTGYSGRDESVMAMLSEAMRVPGAFPHGLYWLSSDDPQRLPPAVRRLLDEATGRGVGARLVRAATFDEALGAVARQTHLPDEQARALASRAPRARVVDAALPQGTGRQFPALRLNALPVLSGPRQAWRVALEAPVHGPLAHLLRERGAEGVAVGRGDHALAFGSAAHLSQALAPLRPGAASLVEFRALGEQYDAIERGLVYDALVRALGRGLPLRPLLRQRGHALLVGQNDPGGLLGPLGRAYQGPLTGVVPAAHPAGGRQWAEGVEVALEWRLGRLWLLFEPFTRVRAPVRPGEPGAGPPAVARARRERDPAADWVRERWAARRNTVWAAAVDAWARLLAPTNEATHRLLPAEYAEQRGDAVDAEFTLSGTTAYTRLAS